MAQTIAQFIAEQGLSMTCKRTDSNPNLADSDNMDHWLCNIRISNGDTWPVYFSMGHGHNGKRPDLAEVLDCLASDAAGFENAQDFEDWASEYGYDPDSRKAERVYDAIDDQINAMRAFLSPEAYETLLWNTERM